MLINRTNYENYFLLYADNELSATERTLVEEFINTNEDLRIELEMIESTKMTPDELVLTDKSFLYKEIVFDNKLQEQLLLKLDNELPLKQQQTINSLLQSNKVVKAEYDLLNKTKLDANENIIFPNKELLYKKERGTVILFFKWAAAAVVVGLALFGALSNFKSNTSIDDNVAAAPKPIEKNNIEKNNVQKSNNDTLNNTEVIYQNNFVQSKNMSSDVVKNNVIEKEVKEINKNNIENSVTFSRDKRITNIPAEKVIITNEIPESNKFIAQANEKLIELKNKIVDVKQEEVLIASVEKVNKNTKDKLIELEDTYSNTIASSQVEKSENKIMYINEDVVRKSKAGGFFNKARNLLVRAAKIKPGNSIQIAGFELAAK